MVIDASEDAVERLRNQVEVFERELTFVELPIREGFVDHFLNKAFQFRGCGLGHRTRGGLNPVGEQANRRLAGLLFWTRVAVILFIDAVDLWV